MKKIKNIWNNNRILIILAAIVLICAIIVSIILVINFYTGTSDSEYGDRLNGIEDVPLSEKYLSDIESTIEELETVDTVSMHLSGKLLYVKITFPESTTLDEAKGIALSSLDNFKEEELAFYDFNFTLSQDKSEATDGYLIEGAKTVNGSGLTWNNNYIPVEESDEVE